MIIEEIEKIKKGNKITNQTRFHKKSYINNEIDYFLNINTPTLRKLAKKYYNSISKELLIQLMTNKVHEYRAIALMILTYKNETNDKKILYNNFNFYKKYIEYINNWDLVDISAPNIVGKYVYITNNPNILFELADSNKLWQERIAIIANLYLIKKVKLNLPMQIITKLLEHNHDLIHKANGWMLREIGKHNIELLNNFIKLNYNNIPRTTLRYAIEKHKEKQRKKILKGDLKWM